MTQWRLVCLFAALHFANGQLLYRRVFGDEIVVFVGVGEETQDVVPWSNASFVQNLLTVANQTHIQDLESFLQIKTAQDNNAMLHVICHGKEPCRVSFGGAEQWKHSSFAWSNDRLETQISVWKHPLRDLVDRDGMMIATLDTGPRATTWEALRVRGLSSDTVEVDVVCGSPDPVVQQPLRVLNFTEKRVRARNYVWAIQGSLPYMTEGDACSARHLAAWDIATDETDRVEVSLHDCTTVRVQDATTTFYLNNTFSMQVWTDQPLAFCGTPAATLRVHGTAAVVYPSPSTGNRINAPWRLRLPLRPLRVPHFESNTGDGFIGGGGGVFCRIGWRRPGPVGNHGDVADRHGD